MTATRGLVLIASVAAAGALLRAADRTTGSPAAAARLKTISAKVHSKGASLIIEATGFAPPTINRALAGALARPLTWNLVVSNVPGPQVPLYLLGRRIESIHPLVPLSPQGRALSVGVLSYDGGVFFGLVGDRELVSDLDRFGADLEAALAEQIGAER